MYGHRVIDIATMIFCGIDVWLSSHTYYIVVRDIATMIFLLLLSMYCHRVIDVTILLHICCSIILLRQKKKIQEYPGANSWLRHCPPAHMLPHRPLLLPRHLLLRAARRGQMETAAGRDLDLAGPLHDLLPPVEFCCAYGSTLLHACPDGTSMVDYILGVADPLQWHTENLARNPMHYSSWMARRGPEAVTWLADRVGVGVYFNPFVEWRDKRIKYGVVGMKDLAMDVLTWDQFYLSGRLQKPVRVLVDNWDIRKVNTVNLKMSTSASLLLLPEEFTEYDLYAKICSLSYMGDLRMLFAEDKYKVKKIMDGSFQPFQLMYRPMIQEYISEGILKMSAYRQQKAFKQDCGVSATNELFSSLPCMIQRRLQGRFSSNSREIPTHTLVPSKEVAAASVRTALRRRVMVSSARQAACGLLASGGVVAARYLGKKMSKAWKSWTF